MAGRVFALLTSAALIVPGSASAQHAAGQVSAKEGGQPIAGAVVQLVGSDSTVINSVLTDDRGRFAFPAQGCGPRDGFLSVVRIGYRPLRAAIPDLPQDCSAWVITLETDAVRLPEVTVTTSRNRDLERVGFYARQRIGFGTFITRDVIEDKYSTQSQLAELIQKIPSVFYVDQAQNSAMVYLRAQAGMDGKPCAALIFIDGLAYPTRVLPRTMTMDVEALEIYRGPAQVPAQYGGANSACGVVVIWTRTGAGR